MFNKKKNTVVTKMFFRKLKVNFGRKLQFRPRGRPTAVSFRSVLLEMIDLVIKFKCLQKRYLRLNSSFFGCLIII